MTDTRPPKSYTLPLHDALPIWSRGRRPEPQLPVEPGRRVVILERPLDGLGPDRPVGPELDLANGADRAGLRSEEHTSELQSQSNLVCRLLLEKKKKQERKNKITIA